MKSFVVLVAAVAAASLVSARADILANWTFETLSSTNSIFGAGDSPAATQSGVGADFGSGTASAAHASAATAWSTPAGNGSPHSWSANTWAVGDYYQFEVSATGFKDLSVSYDQISSSTGPGIFKFGYSTDGVNFTYGSDYTVLVNSSPNVWSAGTPILTSSFSENLSAIIALNNQATVFFRLVDDATTSASQANGGSTAPGSTGTDRVDNFVVSADPVPEPASLAFGLVGGFAWLVALRRKR